MTDNPNQTATAELICTRISHDIIGNIGAVANAVELLEEGDLDFLDDIKSILKVSSGVLSSRLKFFRMAFGLANANLEDLGAVETACKDYLDTLGNKNYPIELRFKLVDTCFSKPALLSVMIVADTIIKGGLVYVEQQGNKLFVASQSNGNVPAEKIAALQEAIRNDSPDNTAQYAPVYYLKEILKTMPYNLYIIDSGTFGMAIAEGI